MQKLLIIIFFFFLNCNHDLSPLEKEKFFHQNNLYRLKLVHIDNFWKGDTITYISDFVTANFNNHAGFIKSLRYSANKKVVAVSVFESKELAIDAMEERINEVSMLIYQGDVHKKIKDKWWWGIYCYYQRAVFINQWNTIVEAGINDYDYANDDSIRILLENTAFELANRVDTLSE